MWSGCQRLVRQVPALSRCADDEIMSSALIASSAIHRCIRIHIQLCVFKGPRLKLLYRFWSNYKSSSYLSLLTERSMSDNDASLFVCHHGNGPSLLLVQANVLGKSGSIARVSEIFSLPNLDQTFYGNWSYY